MSKDFFKFFTRSDKLIQTLQMCVKWRHKHEKRKHIKCNKIIQAYRSRCSTETHRVRPESLKIFRMVHEQGEVSLLRVAFLNTMIPDFFLSCGTFLNNNPVKPAKNNKRMLIAAAFYFVDPVQKDRQKKSKDDSKLCQLQLSVNKSQMLHKFSTWILFASAPVNSYSMPFSSSLSRRFSLTSK